MNTHSGSIHKTKPLLSVSYVLDLHVDNEQGTSTTKKIWINVSLCQIYDGRMTSGIQIIWWDYLIAYLPLIFAAWLRQTLPETPRCQHGGWGRSGVWLWSSYAVIWREVLSDALMSHWGPYIQKAAPLNCVWEEGTRRPSPCGKSWKSARMSPAAHLGPCLVRLYVYKELTAFALRFDLCNSFWANGVAATLSICHAAY